MLYCIRTNYSQSNDQFRSVVSGLGRSTELANPLLVGIYNLVSLLLVYPEASRVIPLPALALTLEHFRAIPNLLAHSISFPAFLVFWPKKVSKGKFVNLDGKVNCMKRIIKALSMIL